MPDTGTRFRRDVLLVSLLLGLGTAAAAQEPGDQRLVFRTRVDLATVNASILEGGRPARDVSPADLHVHEDGTERDIAFVLRPADAALDVALLLDASDSMARTNAPGHALRLLDGLRPRDCILFLPFADGVRQRLWAAPDDPALRAAIADIPTDGATRLYDALVMAQAEMFLRAQDPAVVEHFRPPKALVDPLDAFRFRPVYAYLFRTASLPAPGTACRDPGEGPRRRAIVAVTDGLETAGAMTSIDALRAGWAMETPVYIVSVKRRGGIDTEAQPLRDERLWRQQPLELGGGLDIDPLLAILEYNADLERIASVLDHNMEAIAAASGGHVFWDRTYARGFDRALQWLRAYHVIGYRTEERADLVEREVTVAAAREGLDIVRVDAVTVRRPSTDTASAVALAAGFDHMARGALSAADAELARVEDLDPEMGGLHLARGLLALQHDEIAAAIGHLRVAVDRSPWLPGPDLLLASLYERSGHPGPAWEHALHAAALTGDRRVLDRLLAAGEAPESIRRRLDAPRIVLRGASMRRLDARDAWLAEPLLTAVAGFVRADPDVDLTARIELADAHLSLWIRDAGSDRRQSVDAALVLTAEGQPPLVEDLAVADRADATSIRDGAGRSVAALIREYCARSPSCD